MEARAEYTTLYKRMTKTHSSESSLSNAAMYFNSEGQLIWWNGGDRKLPKGITWISMNDFRSVSSAPDYQKAVDNLIKMRTENPLVPIAHNGNPVAAEWH